MPPLAISCWRHSVFGLSVNRVRVCVLCMHDYTTSFSAGRPINCLWECHQILSLVQFETKMNQFDFEV